MANTTNINPPPLRKVFILEDHPVFREGLVQILNNERDLKVCGAAENAEAALRAVPKLKPDLILVDIGLTGKSGLEFIKEIRAVNRSVKLLVVSMHDEALYADRVLRAGGDGYIMKQENPEELVHAIRDVLAGHIYVSEEVLTSGRKGSAKRSTKTKTRPLDQLTDSELEFLESLGKGKSNQEIARQLRVSVQAVVALCAQIKEKLNLKSANALIRYAVCWVETGAS
jgi:DNA-binding NarL/FixJ family response regulator